MKRLTSGLRSIADAALRHHRLLGGLGLLEQTRLCHRPSSGLKVLYVCQTQLLVASCAAVAMEIKREGEGIVCW